MKKGPAKNYPSIGIRLTPQMIDYVTRLGAGNISAGIIRICTEHAMQLSPIGFHNTAMDALKSYQTPQEGIELVGQNGN